MHPSLALHLHPMCKDVILALEKCHKERSFAKFWGACNEARRELDKCLGEEFEVMRKENFLKSQEYERRQKAEQKERERENKNN